MLFFFFVVVRLVILPSEWLWSFSLGVYVFFFFSKNAYFRFMFFEKKKIVST